MELGSHGLRVIAWTVSVVCATFLFQFSTTGFAEVGALVLGTLGVSGELSAVWRSSSCVVRGWRL